MSKEFETVPQNGTEMRRLVSDAMAHMEALNYSSRRSGECRRVWMALVQFAEVNGFNSLTKELCECFMASYDAPEDGVWKPLKSMPHRVRTIVVMLLEFSLNGCWKLRHAREKIVPLPLTLADAYHSFILFSEEVKQVRPNTLSLHKHFLAFFLRFLDANGIDSWSQLGAPLLSKFLCSQSHLSHRTINSVASMIRVFLRYLYAEEIITEDLSLHVPRVRIPMEQHLPSVWTRQDVESLLNAVDRNSPVGKRDYVMLLLASRLGMRASDIRTLCLENLNWNDSVITLRQRKTGRNLTLPITEEIGKALIDYLQHARPSTSYRELFLRMQAPYQPFCENNRFYTMVTTYRRRAGLFIPKRAKRGMHSLRHTVACRLLEAETPFETISDILGHASIESTRTYARADIHSLRSAALDTEEAPHV